MQANSQVTATLWHQRLQGCCRCWSQPAGSFPFLVTRNWNCFSSRLCLVWHLGWEIGVSKLNTNCVSLRFLFNNCFTKTTLFQGCFLGHNCISHKGWVSEGKAKTILPVPWWGLTTVSCPSLALKTWGSGPTVNTIVPSFPEPMRNRRLQTQTITSVMLSLQ